jgi:hypothetical protein
VAGETFYRKISPASQGGGWSTIVNDLISDTAHRALTRKNSYIVRSQPNLLRGSAALRALNANTNAEPGFLVRASLGEALGLMEDGLGKVGAELEDLTKKAAQAPRERTRRGLGDDGPPLLGRIKEDNGGDGGMSFIIANFQEF